MLAGREARREVVRVDLPGFGQTPMPSGDYTPAAVTDALEAHLRTCAPQDLGGADLVGSSMGVVSCWRWAAASWAAAKWVTASSPSTPAASWSPAQK